MEKERVSEMLTDLECEILSMFLHGKVTYTEVRNLIERLEKIQANLNDYLGKERK